MYRGRFAPSPTGPLHFGSLVAALASYLEARHAGGEWCIRIEDVDKPRSRPEAARDILATLDAFGFRGDGEVLYQSQRGTIYQSYIDQLGSLVYPCSCSRKDVGEAVYPGTCRNGAEPGKPVRAMRLRVSGEEICFDDPIQGRFCQVLERDLGDFPLYSHGANTYSYQLAVVVDDELQGITNVVRGSDLLDSTPRQIYLQRKLGFRPLQYMHFPVAVGADGEKLSKQNLAPAIDRSIAAHVLTQGLEFLGQSTPANLSLDELWDWAIANWNPDRIPRSMKRYADLRIQT